MLPPGMTERAFRDVLAALPAERLDGAQAADGRPITPAMLARGDFALRAIGPGRYVLDAGGRDVPDARHPGAAFILDLNGAEPAAAPAAQPAGEPARRRAAPRSLVRPIEGWEDAP